MSAKKVECPMSRANGALGAGRLDSPVGIDGGADGGVLVGAGLGTVVGVDVGTDVGVVPVGWRT